MTFAPRETHRRQRLGVIETRVSPILISFGTPLFMGRSLGEAAGVTRGNRTVRSLEFGQACLMDWGMPKMLNLMAACAENRVMGRQNRLPWRIPEDLEFFHAETAGKTILLGRICYQTWPRARQDGRRLIVVSSDRGLSGDGVQVAASVPEGLGIAE